MPFDEKMEVVSNKKKLFIKRERIRRTLMHVKPDVVFCVEKEDAELIMAWIKELERKVDELEKILAANRKNKA